MPFCAYCRWEYRGTPRFCRECGRPIFRRPRATAPGPATAALQPDGADWSGAAVPSWALLPTADALLVAAGLLGGAVFLVAALGSTASPLAGFPLDEAWARLVYARSLASEGRLAFNPGPPEAAPSSLLWIGLMALLIKTLGALGLSVVAVAKGASLLAGGATAALTGRLASRAAGSHVFGFVVGLLVALDPGFGYASASGVEATLFAALAVAAVLAFLEGRWRLAGALLATATLTRFEGLLLALLIALSALLPRLPELRAGLARRRLPGRRALLVGAALVVPALAAFWLWSAVDGAPSGAAWPRQLELALPSLAAPRLADLVGLWRGYLASSVWALAGPGPLAALLLLGLGVWWLIDRSRRIAAPVALFPLLAGLGAAAVVGASAAWGFEQRRLLDPTRPFLTLLLGLGLLALWRLGRAWAALRPVDRRRPPIVAAATVLAAALPLAGLAPLWARLPLEYAQAATALNDTYFALARYARDELPAEALIVALEPGALRYVSRRPVADARGLHTRGLAGVPVLEALTGARAEYAALPRLPLYESWPTATLVQEFAPPPGLGPPVGLYRVAPGGAPAPRDGLYAFPLEALRRLDYLDVGSEAAERAHAYQIEGPRGTTRVLLRVTAQRAVEDDGRAFTGAESLELAAEPGRDLIVARRFESGPATMLLRIDGQAVGEWRPRAARYAVAEDTFRVPGGVVRRPRVQVRLELLGASAPRAVTFGYWSFVDR